MVNMNDEAHVRKKRRLSSEDEESNPLSDFEDEAAADAAGDDQVDNLVTLEESRPKKRTILSTKKFSDSREAIAKTGVIYLSRIPPRLSPTKIRQLLGPYGTVLRIFLAPESTATYHRRIKSGGSRKKQFTEGWIEFEDKKVAKKVAVMLNAERIGGKKGDFLYDDLWCMKYLPKFKWHHLTAQIGILLILTELICLAYQNASRAEKLRNEIAQEKRENVAFMRNAERSKMIQNIQRKRKERNDESMPTEKTQIRRQFTQNSVIKKNDENKNASQGSILKRVFD